MISFINDYCQCAQEEILKRITAMGPEKNVGYGMDRYCESAKERIRKACHAPEADVRFLVGGTQTNQVVIDSVLAPYEGVLAADSGHVSVHEAGAIEYTGRKVLNVPGRDGKVDPAALRRYMEIFNGDSFHEHMVFPGMVYITHPTELGTLYTKKELTELRKVCDDFHLKLYLDGARLSYGLVSKGTDVTLSDIAELTDVFYIGGTKVGLLFGEAVVFPKGNAPEHFMNLIKKHGALLAKGWLLGIQFDTLFRDELYLKIAKNAIAAADRIRAAFREKGYSLYMENPTNQVFVVLEDSTMKKLAEKVEFGFWEKADETHTVVRFCTSWGTSEEDVDALIRLL